MGGSGTVSTERRGRPRRDDQVEPRGGCRREHEPRGADRRRARFVRLDGARGASGSRSRNAGPASRSSEAKATFDQVGDGFRMTRMHLRIRGTVDGLDEEGFRSAAEDAKDNCPVSQALSDDVEVTVEAALA